MPATESTVSFKAVITVKAIDEQEQITTALPTPSSSGHPVHSGEEVFGSSEQVGATPPSGNARGTSVSFGGTQVKRLTDVPVPRSIAELLQMLDVDAAKTCLKCGCNVCLGRKGAGDRGGMGEERQTEGWWVMPPTSSLERPLRWKRAAHEDGREEEEEASFQYHTASNGGERSVKKSESGDETEEEYICLTTTHTSVTDQKGKTSLQRLRQQQSFVAAAHSSSDCHSSNHIYRIVGKFGSRRVQIHVDYQLVDFLTSSQQRAGLADISCASLYTEDAEANESQMEKRCDAPSILEGYEVLGGGYSVFGMPTLFVDIECSERTVAAFTTQTCIDIPPRPNEWTDVSGSGTRDGLDKACLVAETPDTRQPGDSIKCSDAEVDFELLSCPKGNDEEAVITGNAPETDAADVTPSTGTGGGDSVAARNRSQLRLARSKGYCRGRNRHNRLLPSRRIQGGIGKAGHRPAMDVHWRVGIIRRVGGCQLRRIKREEASESGRRHHVVMMTCKVVPRTVLGVSSSHPCREGGSQSAVVSPAGQSASSTRASSQDYCVAGGLLLGGVISRASGYPTRKRSNSTLDGSRPLSLVTPPLMISQRLLMYRQSDKALAPAATVSSLTQAASGLLMSSLCPSIPLKCPRAAEDLFQARVVKPVLACEGMGIVPFPAPSQSLRRSSWAATTPSLSLLFPNPLVSSSGEQFSSQSEIDLQPHQLSEGNIGDRLTGGGAVGAVRYREEGSQAITVVGSSTSNSNNVPVAVRRGTDEAGAISKRTCGWHSKTSTVPIHAFAVEGGSASGTDSFEAVVRTTTTTQAATFICGSHQQGTADSVSTCYVSTFIAGVPADVVMSSTPSSLIRDADIQIDGGHVDKQVEEMSNTVAAESGSVHSQDQSTCSSGELDVSADFSSPVLVQSAILLPFFSYTTDNVQGSSRGRQGSFAGCTKSAADSRESQADNKCVPFPSIMTASISSFLLCSHLSVPALESGASADGRVESPGLSTPNDEALTADASRSSAAEPKDAYSPVLSLRHLSALRRLQDISDVSRQSFRCPTAVFPIRHGHSALSANSNSDGSTTPPTRRRSDVDSRSSASSRSSSPSESESAGASTRPRTNPFFPPMLQRYSRKYYASSAGQTKTQDHDLDSSTKAPSAASGWRNVLGGGSPESSGSCLQGSSHSTTEPPIHKLSRWWRM
eukprot:GHVS01088796.1.p1 GENE.GHVS01088796.1~~GHVS01088796.1.p1  ORF type:complete len:1184 (+),score=128.98 GHVS01088796.1:268-3819(+)